MAGFNDLRNQVENYLQAGPKAREAILDKTIAAITKLPNKVISKAETLKAYKALVSAIFLSRVANIANQKSVDPESNDESEEIKKSPSLYPIYLTPTGRCRFLTLEDSLVLPRHQDSEEDYLQSIVDEHLEKQHSNLFETATSYYDSVDAPKVHQALRDSLHEFPQTHGLNILRLAFLANLDDEALSNSALLKKMMGTLNTFVPNGDEKAQQSQRELLNQLRVNFQLLTFHLTPLYNEAVAFLKTKLQKEAISLSDDKSTETTLLNEFFNSKGINTLPLQKEHYSGRRDSEYLNLFEATARLNTIGLPDVLMMFEAQSAFFKKHTPSFNDETSELYTVTKTSLVKNITLIKDDLKAITETQKKQFDAALQDIVTLKERYTSKEHKPLLTHLNSLHAELQSLAKSDNEDLNTLTEIAKTTSDMLNSKLSVDQYYDYAAGIKQGQASPGLNALGALMLILAAVAAAVCLTGCAMLATGVTAAVMATGSITFFGLSRQNGVAKTTDNIAHFVHADASTLSRMP